jgi:branched-chain amino acid transport system ATP-binding protein
MRSTGAALLDVQDLSLAFGSIVALDRLSFGMDEGEICGLIGPNGAGKTSLFNCLSRLYQPTAGAITFRGKNLLDVPAHQIPKLGIARTFQNVALFPTMTVEQNVTVGLHSQFFHGIVACGLRLPSVNKTSHACRDRVDLLMELLGLQTVRQRLVSSLPFGTRKRVEMARALAGSPKLLLLDEPAAGLNYAEVNELRDLIMRIRTEFVTAVLVVEHHMNLVMKVSDRVVALEFGRLIAHGEPADIQAHPDVIRAYLGGDHG